MCTVTKTWKEKATERTKENKALKKRINELKSSRDKWKFKFENIKSKVIESKKKNSD